MLAPTGTISFMMDCDTTGIEPDIALVKYKQLAGGGMLKIVNQTVPLALQTLGYDEPQIESIVGLHRQATTRSRAPPDLKAEHLPVFDCAFQPRNGTRSIPWQAHIRMMAAAQPFLSGAISKTVNMPRDTTPDDIADAYHGRLAAGPEGPGHLPRRLEGEPAAVDQAPKPTRRPPSRLAAPRRERLPDTRQSITHKFNIAGHEGYITVGLYPDGRPGELFITMAKEGSTIGGLMDCFGTAVSMSLQYGVPLEVYVNKFSHTRFEPMGHTKNPDIRIAKSIVDYIFRWLGITFLPGYREANAGMQAETAPRATGDDSEGETMPAARRPAGRARGQDRPRRRPRRRRRSRLRQRRHPGQRSRAEPMAQATVRRMPKRHTPTARPSTATDRPPPPPPKSAQACWSGPESAPKFELHSSGAGPKLRSEQFATFQTDAPACDNCGAITVRNGNCYLCHNCGNSMGCS